jgi:hypothetical protein
MTDVTDVGYPAGQRAALSRSPLTNSYSRFMMTIEKAKKAEKERTNPLLSVPDDVIVNALASAQRVLR